jgi:bilin biosynthesis protein
MRDLKNPDKTSREFTVETSKKCRSLIDDLDNKDKNVRDKAHQVLVAEGQTTLKPLVEALSYPNKKIRSEAGKILDEINIDWVGYANQNTIAALINDLDDEDGFARIRIRNFLVMIGKRATNPLIEALENKTGIARWEVAKALERIHDPRAIEALIKALDYEPFEIRWLAAEGLVAIGSIALIPLLHRLIEKPGSEWLREGAHHILRCNKDVDLRLILQPVLGALEDSESTLQVPLAAKVALDSLEERIFWALNV